MDIRKNTTKRDVDLFPKHTIAILALLTTLTIYIGYTYTIQYGILSSTSILCYIGIRNINIWHKELKNDGYAAISHLHTSYLSVLFLFFGMAPILYVIMNNIILSLVVSLVISLFYASLISALAFRDISEDKRNQVIDTYTGPSVVYQKEGPYIEHTEEIAFENRE